jgi:hypothetical protein
VSLREISFREREEMVDRVVTAEGWPVDMIPTFDDEVGLATAAASRLLVHLDTRPANVATMHGHALIEKRVRVRWANLGTVYEDIRRRGGDVVLDAFSGLEGQMDLVEHDGAGGLLVSDPKFRGFVPDANAIGDTGEAEARAQLPDLQGSWYSTILSAVFPEARSVSFRQVEVYAGAMFTLDDFLAPGSELVTKEGLPTIAVRNVDANDYWRAWIELTGRKSATETKGRGRNKEPWRPTEKQLEAAVNHRQRLADQSLVVDRVFPLDPAASREVVVDACLRVDAAIRTARRTRPGRIVSNHAGGPCMRRNGCDVQAACRASIGSENFEAVIERMAADGRYTTREQRLARNPEAPR